MKLQKTKWIVTSLVLFAALGVILLKYWHYLVNPWTRDGQVRAVVISVAPRITGPIVNLPIVDNQAVKAGDLLFEIDPRTFVSKLRQAKANLDLTLLNLQALDKNISAAMETLELNEAKIRETQSKIAGLQAQYNLDKKNYERSLDLVRGSVIAISEYDQNKEKRDVSQSQLDQALSALSQAQAAKRQAEADLAKAVVERGPTNDDNPQLRAALAAVEDAQLDCEFTRQLAPVDGYVTNLNLRTGSQAVANQPALALVDVNSYWVAAYFMETQIANMKPGQPAIITFMSYPDKPVRGAVESIGWGIFQNDGSTGQDLLPTVSPTFEWIRLAQRIPVRVRVQLPDDAIKLRVGMTASVLVMTGEPSIDAVQQTPPVPAALQ